LQLPSFTSCPLGRSALILSVLRAVGQVQGRTKLQKILYLANLCGWNSIPDYRYYYYGPFSETVVTELENFVKNGWVEERQSETTYTYNLTRQGQRVADSLAAKMEDPKLIKRTMSLERELHKLASDELEMMATLVFLRKVEPDTSGSDDKLIDRLHELKPKFDRNQIRNGLRIFKILKNFGYA
jgi:uncharacterized protein YwgA